VTAPREDFSAVPAPPVWTWYRIYAALMAVMYVGLVVVGLLMAVLAPAKADDPPPWFIGLILGCFGIPFGGAYVAAFFVPRRPWAWVYHLVLICVGMTSACCLPACIPLLIFWIKPETKAFFGRA